AVAESLVGLHLAAGVVPVLGFLLDEAQLEQAALDTDLPLRPGAVLMIAIRPAVRDVPAPGVEPVEILDEGLAVAGSAWAGAPQSAAAARPAASHVEPRAGSFRYIVILSPFSAEPSSQRHPVQANVALH